MRMKEKEKERRTWIAKRVVNDSISDVKAAAALVYCLSTFCSAPPRNCWRAGAVNCGVTGACRAGVKDASPHKQ
jgi:hypothetical protein